MKKNRMILIALCLLFLLAVLSAGGMFYYNHSLEGDIQEQTQEETTYEKVYALIVDNPESSFWQSVYTSAYEEAKSHGIYLELMGLDSLNNDTMEDWMRMSIAQSVDGILLEYTGGQELQDLIDTAVDAGIPVITVSEDAPQSKRQSFVGVNTYQLGETYAERVVSLINKNTKRIMILTKNAEEEDNQKMISVQISNAVTDSKKAGGPIQVEVKNIQEQSAFDAEETIRNVFFATAGPPDIIVCLDEGDTERVYQAVIDYNEVGDVDIVGYYTTATILEGIQKDIISLTLELDADQMGVYAIQALEEYEQEGRVSDYYSIDVNIIGPNNVEDYIKDEEENS